MEKHNVLFDGTCETDSLSEYDTYPLNKMLLLIYLAAYLLILFIAFLAGFSQGL